VERRLLKNNTYQELQLELSKVQSDSAALFAREQRYEDEIAEARRMAGVIAQVETELTQLDRDYSIRKQNYESLIKRREAAKLTREAGQSVDAIEFRLVEPARIPKNPSGPNRLLLTANVFAIAIGAGIGLAWLLSQLRPVFYSRKQLAEFAGLPVLGAISMLSSRRENALRKLGIGLYAFGWLTLTGVFGVFAMASILNIDLSARVAEMTRTLL
jgi:hypothetical protein